MKGAVIAVAALACSCEAFVPTMSANGVSRADFAKAIAVGVVGAAAPAFALGASPKQNLFGIIGTNPNDVGGGGLSSPYAETDTYSPYSPYAHTADGSAIFSGVTDEMTKRYVSTLKDCEKRFSQIPSWTSNGEWMEIRGELTRKAYDLRGAMNALAAKSPQGLTAAKAYYQDLEQMMDYARLKDAAKVQAAYEKSQADLNAYLKSI